MKARSIVGTVLTTLFVILATYLSRNNMVKQGAIPESKQSVPLSQPRDQTNQDPSIKCHMRGLLPDPVCTPGAVDPAVIQDNIQQTICVQGYTKTVRPSASYTDQLKRQQMNEYGFTDGVRDHEEDHLISLELGGAPSDPKNLWPEPGSSPNPKDKIENLCHQKVCDGQLTLQEAQKEISNDWTTACQ